MKFSKKVKVCSRGASADWLALKPADIRRTLKAHSDSMRAAITVPMTYIVHCAVKALYGKYFDKQEIRQLSERSGLTAREIIAANAAYEIAQSATKMFGLCTSAVARIGGRLHHYRTLDWALAGTGPNTCVFDWNMYGSKFQSIGWPGFVGVVSGAKKGFSISLNQATPTKMLQRGTPPVMVIREALTTKDDYRAAVTLILASSVSSNCSFMLCGTTDACIIEKRGRANIVENLGSSDVLVKTNHNQYDGATDESIIDSINRKSKAEKILRKAARTNRVPTCRGFAVSPICHECTAQVMNLDPYEGTIEGYWRDTDQSCSDLR